ncbi:MAG: hypothetical protein JWL92_128 [Candidatus Nomurabacteria bacterium]|nr:hypothetical protein [Candidatus Nomurabacteria bacterium]
MNTRHRNSQILFATKAWLRRGIHFMYGAFIEPKTFDEDSKRHEFILNTILCSVIILLLILDFFILIASIEKGSLYDGISLASFSATVGIFISLLILSRRGKYSIASFILLFIYFIGTTYGAIQWTIWLPFVAISYVVIIVISSILISTRFSLVVTAIIAITVCTITHLQTRNIITPDVHWKYAWISMHEPIQLSIVLFLIAAISWLSNREMERSLLRARISEQALLEERNLLEIKVEERTSELKDMQKDKVSQLYRFAEFGKLSTGVFHDLMNSLNIVVNNVERIETTREHLPEVKDHMFKAVTASRRMGNYIRSVRKQIATDNSEGVFSLEKEIRDAVDIVSFKAREAAVHITVEIQDDITLHGNALKFYQIILNLLMNAIESCEDRTGGSITVRLQHEESHAKLTIADNGCGMDSATVAKVYEEFFTTKSYEKGTGFGLSQTKELVEKEFKGTIEIVSVLNEGTEFIITFPLQKYEDHPADN